MTLGKIQGKVTTNNFSFVADAPTKKFQYLEVEHPEYGKVLAQVMELERTKETKAFCHVLGYKDDKGNLRAIRTPFEQNASVFAASDKFLSETLRFNAKNGAYIGLLEGKDIPVQIDLQKMLTKHVAILAKTGSGKSYAAGVLIEEVAQSGYPIVIIDPHGEYESLKVAGEETAQNARFNVKPLGLGKKVECFGNVEASPGCKPLKLSEELSQKELIHMLPAKLTNAQLSILYSVLKKKNLDFEELNEELLAEDSPHKWGVIQSLEYLRELGLFSKTPTSMRDLVKPNKVSIIDLKGYEPYIQEIICYKLLTDMFEWRKRNRIPPFLLVVEEAHNFIPERSFGEAKSSRILRTIASEGRKFGLGMCVITQRPARVDKNVLSQCNTQIILKVTNPNDLRAITSSLETITANTESEIKNLPIGTALVAGVVDMPLFVEIRPRKTKHGGEAQTEVDENHIDAHAKGEIFPVIMPRTNPNDLALIEGTNKDVYKPVLIPAILIHAKRGLKDITWLVDLVQGRVITNVDDISGIQIPDLTKLSKQQTKVLEAALKLKEFKAAQVGLEAGVGALAVQDILESLLQMQFLESDGRKYGLTEQVELVRDPVSFQVPRKISYVAFSNPKMKNTRIDSEKVQEKVKMVMKVHDVNECYIVEYEK